MVEWDPNCEANHGEDCVRCGGDFEIVIVVVGGGGGSEE